MLQLLLWWHRVDIVHSLHYRFPLLPPCARIVTIHDLTHTLWLQLHTRGCRWIFHNFSRMAMQRAEGTLFVSELTLADAERLVPNPRQLRSVSPLGWSLIKLLMK